MLSLLTRFGSSRRGGGGGSPTEYGISAVASTFENSNSSQRGYSFTTVGSAQCVGARVWLNATSDEIARLWRIGDESLVASVAITSSAAGWVEGLFASPVTLDSAEEYIVTTRAAAGTSRKGLISDWGDFTPNTSRITITGFTNSSANTYPGKGASATPDLFGLADVILSE